jgi:hypothetical protein
MFVTFYDENFNALQDNSSLNVADFSIKRKAVDFDDFNFTSEPYLLNVNPCFVVLKDDYGVLKYSAFAGIPQLTNENKTECQCSDLKTIFNNNIVASFGTYSYLDDYFSAVLTAFNTQVLQGSFSLVVDLTAINTIAISDLMPSTDLAVYNVWEDCILPYLKYYDCYLTCDLSIKNKTINVYVKKIDRETKVLRAWEYGLKNIGKWVSSINETQAVVSVSGSLTYGDKFILLKNNSITTTASLRDLYPIKNTIILKETTDSGELTDLLNEANQEALEKIVDGRYNESIEITSADFNNVDFGTSFNVYTEKGVFYKKLPVGIITETNENAKTITIGYKIDDISFYI